MKYRFFQICLVSTVFLFLTPITQSDDRADVIIMHDISPYADRSPAVLDLPTKYPSGENAYLYRFLED